MFIKDCYQNLLANALGKYKGNHFYIVKFSFDFIGLMNDVDFYNYFANGHIEDGYSFKRI